MVKIIKLIKYFFLGFGALTLLGGVFYLLLPKGPGELMEFDDPYKKDRPAAVGKTQMAATGTPWATAAALEVLDRGGNAVDAAVAALLVLNVTHFEDAGFACVAPVLIHDAKTGRVVSYIGAGKAPDAATIELFTSKGHKTVPKYNILSQLIPASPDVMTAMLARYGTMSFSELCAPAIKLAEEGFPVHSVLLRHLSFPVHLRLGLSLLMPYNAEVIMGGRWWKPLYHKERIKLPDLARTLRALSGSEHRALKAGKSRTEALQAVRNYFYKGPIAESIVKFHREKGGLFTMEDLAKYEGGWEEPLAGSFREYTVYANRTWCQGAIVPMVLQMLEPLDLKKMGHNSPEYVHTVIQAIELAMADREKYFGDPAFVKVPERGLLSKRYAAARRKLMTPGKAFGKLPPHGNPLEFGDIFLEKRGSDPIVDRVGFTPGSDPKNQGFFATHTPRLGRDTTYLSIVDRRGNAVSLTPSDFPESPMVPGMGILLGIRMTQFRLEADHPSSLAPGKRPTITPNASMVFKNGRFYMSFGTPGGDMQTQALVQVFLNHIVFGMDIQQAIDAPRFRSLNWPDSFSPHRYFPGEIHLEESLYKKAADALSKMGYRVTMKEDRDLDFSAVCAVVKDSAGGRLVGGADSRKESWADGR
ncbi:MAG TPA: gamma-glutamyltransferase family protein [Spirochaetes bacterium]|nr:gamma-glutamyltransferase family protein [Spirochaetota bacterium]